MYSHLEPKIPEECLVTKLTYHFEERIVRARQYGQVKTIGGMEALLESYEQEAYYRGNRRRLENPNERRNDQPRDNRQRVNYVRTNNNDDNNRNTNYIIDLEDDDAVLTMDEHMTTNTTETMTTGVHREVTAQRTQDPEMGTKKETYHLETNTGVTLSLIHI